MNGGPDPYNLQRFVNAQESVITDVLAELKQGRKYGHWIWFIFPQLNGLGQSSTSEFYGVSSLAEAEAYLEHPLLGPRLIHCTELVIAAETGDAEEIFGEVDAMKFRSCMTLFAQAAPANQIFTDALEKYFGGEPDWMTLSYLKGRRA